MNPQIVHEHPHPIRTARGVFRAYVAGIERVDGTWAGWIEYEPEGGGARLKTSQETSQPNRGALAYWATGLEDLYYDGALERATG